MAAERKGAADCLNGSPYVSFSTSGNEFEGTLPKSGDYKIRVYMMRNAARRDETANYRLKMIVTGAAENATSSTVPEPSPEKPDSTRSNDLRC